MMKVHRDGATFKAARITGPTHHFLAVEFAKSSQPYEIVFAETNEVVVDTNTVDCLQRAVVDCSEMLPILGTYHIKRLAISQRDAPSEAAYRQLLHRIIADATDELTA